MKFYRIFLCNNFYILGTSHQQLLYQYHYFFNKFSDVDEAEVDVDEPRRQADIEDDQEHINADTNQPEVSNDAFEDVQAHIDADTNQAEVSNDAVEDVHNSDTPARGRMRRDAMQQQIKNSSKWKTSSEKQLGVNLVIGSVVLIQVDKVDRGKTDFQFLPGVVVQITDRSLYRIATSAGILKSCYNRGDLRLREGANASDYDLQDMLEHWEEQGTKRVSVREAVALISPTGGQGYQKCSCSSKCDSKRCACFKAGLYCNSRCHPSNAKCANCAHD